MRGCLAAGDWCEVLALSRQEVEGGCTMTDCLMELGLLNASSSSHTELLISVSCLFSRMYWPGPRCRMLASSLLLAGRGLVSLQTRCGATAAAASVSRLSLVVARPRPGVSSSPGRCTLISPAWMKSALVSAAQSSSSSSGLVLSVGSQYLII